MHKQLISVKVQPATKRQANPDFKGGVPRSGESPTSRKTLKMIQTKLRKSSGEGVMRQFVEQ